MPEDHPVLKYYRWFWTVGDGWNGQHSAAHAGVKRRRVRLPHLLRSRRAPAEHSGAAATSTSSRTGHTPIPIRSDRTLRRPALRNGRGRRKEAVGHEDDPAHLVPFPDRADRDHHRRNGAMDRPRSRRRLHHDRAMHLRQALWSKLSRPIRGIMYHGWQSLVETDTPEPIVTPIRTPGTN